MRKFGSDGASTNLDESLYTQPMNFRSPFQNLHDYEAWDTHFSMDDLALIDVFESVVNYLYMRKVLPEIEGNAKTGRKKEVIKLDQGFLNALLITGRREGYDQLNNKSVNWLNEYSNGVNLAEYIDALIDFINLLIVKLEEGKYSRENQSSEETQAVYQEFSHAQKTLEIVLKNIVNSRES